MKERRMVGRMGVVVAVLAIATGVRGQTEPEARYQGAGVARAGEIVYPVNSRVAGMVTVDVSVDASGAVQNVQAVRNLAPFTSAAESGVKGWKFSPAMIGGRPSAGTARISVVFNPFNPGDVSIPNKPVPTPENAGGTNGAFRPADVKTGKYAVYPANTVASGTVVLDVKVGADGRVTGVRVLRGVGVLSEAATRVMKDWEFVPATYKGKAMESNAVVAFVFVAPQVGTM